MATPRLIHNVAALVSVQALGYVLPLITLPYVTRVLGVAGWGSVAWTLVVINYFYTLTNWAFFWTGTRKVATLRDDTEQLSRTFLTIYVGQWILCAIAIAVLVILVAFVPVFHRFAAYFLFATGLIVANVLFPVWFLTGLEMMRQIAIVQILVRLSSVPLIFLLIKKPADAPYLVAIYAATNVCGGILAMHWISRNVDLIWRMPKIRDVFAELAAGSALFGTSTCIGLYSTLTPTVLGIVAGPTVVGYYAIADRVRQLVQAVTKPLSDALFPRMSHLFAKDTAAAHRLILKSSAIILPVAALMSIVLWGAAGIIVVTVAGAKFKAAIPILRWLAPLPIVISLSNVLGVQIMLPQQKMKAFNLIFVAASVLSLSALLPLIHWRGAEGAAMNSLGVECFVTLSMCLYLWRTGYFTAAAAAT